MKHTDILSAAHLTEADLTGGSLKVHSPVDGAVIGEIATHTPADVEAMIVKAKNAFDAWKRVPAPRRGELIRLFGEELRAAKDELGALVTLECGKIFQEGLGEVQEMIDICDLAVGQSRQLYGLTIASERPGHSMRETWHPMGVTGVITAFNFPVAPFAWNFALAIVCGDPVIWKPSEKTPLSAIATAKIWERAVARFGSEAPDGLLHVAIGLGDVGEVLTRSKDVPIISATGSTRMGRIVGPVVAERFTSLRRLFVHEDIRDELVSKLKAVYEALPIGNPLEAGTLVGPLIDADAHTMMENALEAAKAQGGKVTGGAKAEGVGEGRYVHPAIVEMPGQTEIAKAETFAPILYVMSYKSLDEAIALHNDVPQGLSSCIFSTDVRETETFLSAFGSDCGIANVNIGPSGAEIGGAFGGEKETGGGRESGSDVWKAYMRRQTNTVNYSRELPLAQGIRFEI